MPDTFCRQCGMYLPDFDKLERKETPPEQHLKMNTILSVMTAVVSLTLAILLHRFFVVGKQNTPPLIYVTAGFLTAMFFWQAQTTWRNLQLKKQLAQRKGNPKSENAASITNPLNKAAKAKELHEPDFNDAVQHSVVENTTKRLSEKVPRKSR